MSGARARTGLSKPRATERELLETLWRERGGAKKSGVPAYFRANAEAKLQLGHGFHKLPGPIPAGTEANKIETALALLQVVTGDESGTGVFAEAIAAMRELGFAGPDGLKRLEAQAPICDCDAAIEAAYEREIAEGLSDRNAMERVAAELGIPAASFAGAVALVKRKLRELALDDRPRRKPFRAEALPALTTDEKRGLPSESTDLVMRWVAGELSAAEVTATLRALRR